MPQSVVGFRNIRLESQRSFIMSHGLFETIEAGQGKCEIMLGVSRLFIDSNRPTKKPLGGFKLALLKSNRSQTTERVKMARVCPEDELIELLCLREATLLLQQYRLLKHF